MARRGSKPALETYATGERLRWDVRWVYKAKNKKWSIAVKEFGTDLNAAVIFYTKVVAAGKHFPTLRCRNSGFPPPEELQSYWTQRKVKTQVKRRGKTRTVVTYKDVYRSPMKRLNREGKWWCPYCRELREFVRSWEVPYEHPPSKIAGSLMPNEAGLYCPICLVSTRDHNVRKWNPLTERISYEQ